MKLQCGFALVKVFHKLKYEPKLLYPPNIEYPFEQVSICPVGTRLKFHPNTAVSSNV